MADSSFKIILRVTMALVVLAAADYGYQFWRTNQDLMMTKEEVKEEAKSTEGNPQSRASAAVARWPRPNARCLRKCLRLMWL